MCEDLNEMTSKTTAANFLKKCLKHKEHRKRTGCLHASVAPGIIM